LAHLRHAEIGTAHDTLLDSIPHGLKFVDHRPQYRHVSVERHLGHVLHEYGRRPDARDDLDE